MNILYWSLGFFLSIPPTAYAASPKESAVPEPCTIRSPNTGAFFDLNPLHIPDPSTVKSSKHPRDYSWNATGWDLGYNFTVNFCGGVVEDLEKEGGVVGVEKELWRNVSAYYKQGGKVYSIGQQSSSPVLRGRKLVLNYTDGSPCESPSTKHAHTIGDIPPRELVDGDDGDDSKSSSGTRRKNTILSMLCERDPLMQLLTLSFVATPDECTYMFEARSNAACATIETAKQTLSPGGVFGTIMLIAVIVYLVGGCVYSRMVLQQRGWRQLPNYNLWAGMLGFLKDLFIIMTSSCARLLPSRRGYTRLNGGTGGIGRGRSGRDSEAENRLIDELNEEWED